MDETDGRDQQRSEDADDRRRSPGADIEGAVSASDAEGSPASAGEVAPPSQADRVAPMAEKRGAAPDLLNPQRVLHGLRSFLDADDVDEPIAETVLEPTGVAPPVAEDRTGEPLAVERTFAFLDITGFTRFCDQNGEHAAIEILTRFRTIVREVAARRGVRAAKWLGDGVMIVGVEEGPVIATVAEAVVRCERIRLDTHGGIAGGTVLLFEGDDYVGRPVNLAARLCDAAEPGEVLASGLRGPLPSWIASTGTLTVHIAGVGDVAGVSGLAVTDRVAEELRGISAGVA